MVNAAGQLSTDIRFYSVTEQAVTVEIGQEISPVTLAKVTALNQQLQQQPFAGMAGTVPGYATLTVYYDLMVVLQSSLPGKDGFEKATAYIFKLYQQQKAVLKGIGDTVTLPVCYGGNLGPDLDEVARINQLTTDEVARLHSKAIYTVYMIGFMPGFAYLGGLNACLVTPRKATPRPAVLAGSVGIAGQQTGVYPLQTPGGWQIIGRTPLILFDAARSQPALLKAGDSVKFEPIGIGEFNRLSPF